MPLKLPRPNIMIRMIAPLAILLATLFTASLACAKPPREPLDRPNVILIMADDVGIEGLESYGGTSYRTPQLNRFAEQGLRFTHAYAQPLCTNTRIQLMTGLYNNRNWKYFGILDPNAKTIGHWMSEVGYKTCIAGKWQLQSYDPGQEAQLETGLILRRQT